MAKELSGKIAFVTGSGRGLGRVMAERLAEHGADVAIHDLDWTAPAKYGEATDLGEVAKAIEEHGVRTAAVTGNIGDPAAVAKMRADIEAKLGAGRDPGQLRRRRHRRGRRQARAQQRARYPHRGHPGARQQQPDRHDHRLQDLRPADARTRPRHRSSTSPPPPRISAVSDGVIYAILKAAVAHYTRCLAKELMNDGVRVNAVSPGPTKTARFQATRTVDPDEDGFQHQVVRPLCRARRDRRRGGLPRRARARSSSTARCCGSMAG